MAAPTESVKNRAFRLQQRPVGEPGPADLQLVEEDLPPLADGEALVRTLYLSLDPTNRLWMSDMRQYSPPVELGAVMRGIGIGEVVESRRDDMRPGDLVSGYTQWQEYCIADDEAGFGVLPDPLPAPLTAFLGALGHTGLTAYIGLELGGLQPGETVFVSAAGGAVGSIVGQIVKARGARAVGIAERRGEVSPHRRRARFRRLRRPHRRRLARADRSRRRRTGSTSTSRTSAARSWTTCSCA